MRSLDYLCSLAFPQISPQKLCCKKCVQVWGNATPFLNKDAAIQCPKGFIDEDQPLIAPESQ
jgi:hypothetical protein